MVIDPKTAVRVPGQHFRFTGFARKKIEEKP